MNDVKSWLTSKTIWATVLGTLVTVLHAVNVHVGFLDTLDTQAFAGHLADVASGVLFVFAAIFRTTATAKLTA